MRFFGSITALAASASIALLPGSAALAQRQQPSPEQRIERLERQVNELQRRTFPKGRPADTAGFPDDPAATQSSVLSLNQRIEALEQQLLQMQRQTEESANRLRNIENAIGQIRADEQRISALEQRMNAAESAPPQPVGDAPPANSATPPKAKMKSPSQPTKISEAAPSADSGDSQAEAEPSDPGEEAYSEGFHLWEAGKYEAAIDSLRAFVKAYPKHRRVSYANNLVGRALLDKGEPRAAATALLANYRNDPGGERAPDSLFYLGQALAKLGQTGQACKAYSELEAVYGAKIRPDLRKLETDAKAQANCS